MNLKIDRRSSVKILAGSLLLAGCNQSQEDTATVIPTAEQQAFNPETSTLKKIDLKAPPKDLNFANKGFTPQFFDGRKTSKEFIEIGFSLHCGGTRDWLKKNGKKLAQDIKSGKKAALFSHVIRSANELPIGVELMRVGEARYPEAVYATLGLSIHLDRPISTEEVRLFLSESGFKRATGVSDENSRITLLALQKVYQEGLGETQTPIIKKSRIG